MYVYIGMITCCEKSEAAATRDDDCTPKLGRDNVMIWLRIDYIVFNFT